MRHCVVYMPPQQMAPPASAWLGGWGGGAGGAARGGCLSIRHLRYSMQCNIFWKVPKIFIDASPRPPVCFAFYLINDINANWG